MFWVCLWLGMAILLLKTLVYPYLKFKRYSRGMPGDVHICRYIPFVG
jgi:hypothetical protein